MLAWVLHTLKHGWFLGNVCNRKNILNTTIHEAVYNPPYSGLEQQAYLHFSTLASIELSNLSLAPGSYENWGVTSIELLLLQATELMLVTIE